MKGKELKRIITDLFVKVIGVVEKYENSTGKHTFLCLNRWVSKM
jgi:hypothetical protein